MRPRDRHLANSLRKKLISFDKRIRPLRGIHNIAMRETFLEQLLESIRRIKYISVLSGQKFSPRRTDPNDVAFFDPLKAAIIQKRQGNLDEAFWLVFLFVHFGKHRRAGWRYVREIYGRLGGPGLWNWANTSANVTQFRQWLHTHQSQLRRNSGPQGFGNHRKYESLDAKKPNGTGAAIESYIKWVAPLGTHQALIQDACTKVNGDEKRAFDLLYQSMVAVKRFGRTARFDYLTMLGKLGLAQIKPGSTYMTGATGPVTGALLLFNGRTAASLNATNLDTLLTTLDAKLDVGMQVLEDALCNWQKSPSIFKAFRG